MYLSGMGFREVDDDSVDSFFLFDEVDRNACGLNFLPRRVGLLYLRLFYLYLWLLLLHLMYRLNRMA